jgi:hypothetical protein
MAGPFTSHSVCVKKMIVIEHEDVFLVTLEHRDHV